MLTRPTASAVPYPTPHRDAGVSAHWLDADIRLMFAFRTMRGLAVQCVDGGLPVDAGAPVLTAEPPRLREVAPSSEGPQYVRFAG